MATPAATCTEATIPLFQNKENLCWFDSGNFALFHKQRPELDRFFADLKGPDTKPEIAAWKIVEKVYQHFSGKTIQDTPEKLGALMRNFRENSVLQQHFNSHVGRENYTLKSGKTFEKQSFRIRTVDAQNPNKFLYDKTPAKQQKIEFLPDAAIIIKTDTDNSKYIEKEEDSITYHIQVTDEEIRDNFDKVEKPSFSINTGNTNDVMDYIQGYMKKEIFNTLNQLTSAHTKQSYYTPENKNDIKVVDILLPQRISDTTHTFFIDTGYEKNKPIDSKIVLLLIFVDEEDVSADDIVVAVAIDSTFRILF